MFAKPLQSNATTPEEQPVPTKNTPHQYEISDYGYGKDSVKVLHVKRNGPVHSIKEFEVGTHLKLYSQKDYYHGMYAHTLMLNVISLETTCSTYGRNLKSVP